MGDEPTDTEPTHDEFTPDPDEVEYPSTLRITSLPAEQAQAAAKERAEQGGRRGGPARCQLPGPGAAPRAAHRPTVGAA